MRKIVDFGEKIGGARKDMWISNGLSVEDLYEMNEAEKRKFVTRDNVWPLPNAKKLVEEEQVEPLVAYWQRKVRLCVHKEPVIRKDENFDAAIERYVRQTVLLRDLAMKCKTKDDIYGVFKEFSHWQDKGSRYLEFSSNAPVDRFCIDPRVLRSSYDFSRYINTVKKTNFPYQEKSKSDKKKRKKQFVPPQLSRIEREGKDYRHGFHVTPEKWQRDFKFYGVEFGNWMSQKDRQISMDYCYDALKDLAIVLDIDDMDIAYNGNLSIAFGARGLSKASAHYEPMRRVINLTKMHGAGCTAHEWFHSLDDAIGRHYHVADGKLASMTRYTEHLPQSFLDLLHALKYDHNGNSTDFYRGSKSFDKHYAKNSFGYWADTSEMAARAFACYVKDCMGRKSDYLIAHADCYEFAFENQSICAIPQGEERELFNELFDQLFYDLKKIGILHKRPKEKTVPVIRKLAEPSVKYEFEKHISEDFTGQLTFNF